MYIVSLENNFLWELTTYSGEMSWNYEEQSDVI